MKTILLFLIAAAAVLAAIPLVPLQTAVDFLPLRKVGFEAAHVEGNLWEGQLYEAKLAMVPLGDVSSKLSLEDISKGRIRLNVSGTDEVSRLKGVFSYGLGGPGIERFTVGMPVMAGPPPIGGVTLILDNVKAHFPGGQCTGGSGEVRAYLSGALPALGMPGEMTGPALCRDGFLAFDLASPSAREQMAITLLSATKFKVRVFVKPTMSRVADMLTAKGFQPVDDGYAFEEERSL